MRGAQRVGLIVGLYRRRACFIELLMVHGLEMSCTTERMIFDDTADEKNEKQKTIENDKT